MLARRVWMPAFAGTTEGNDVRAGYVYIMANTRNGTLYVGVTSDIVRRIHEHREGAVDGSTKRYNLKCLVWYEEHSEIAVAIRREKAIKAWQRTWKLRLIETENPDWNDLWPSLFGEGQSVADWLENHYGEKPDEN